MAFPDGIADFRSDTVTRPTPAMRAAMAAAEVGDDVYGEDPTVNLLQEESAGLLGMESAVFVPSGTMGNQLALWGHTRRGDDVLCVEGAHIRNSERGAGSALSGVGFRHIGDALGRIGVDHLMAALAKADGYSPPVGLLVWEVTHLASGGTIPPVEEMEVTSAAGRAAGLRQHLDGARLWNAVVASGTAAHRFGGMADTVMFCFSKGLGAPIGSVLCGDAAFISAAIQQRKRLGGAMRQVGVLAAAGRVALAERDRLEEDHRLARRLGTELAERFPAAIDLDRVQTNLVLVAEAELPFGGDRLISELASEGIRVGRLTPDTIRFATHRDVVDADVDRVLAVIDRIS